MWRKARGCIYAVVTHTPELKTFKNTFNRKRTFEKIKKKYKEAEGLGSVYLLASRIRCNDDNLRFLQDLLSKGFKLRFYSKNVSVITAKILDFPEYFFGDEGKYLEFSAIFLKKNYDI